MKMSKRLSKYSLLNRLTAFLLTCLAYCPAQADKPVKIYGNFLKERLSYSGELRYNKTLQEIFRGLEDKVDIDILPLKRASTTFGADSSSCIFPSNEGAWRSLNPRHQDLPLIHSEAFDMISVRAYTLETAKTVLRKEDLFGKRVGHIIGSAGPTILQEFDKINYQPVDSEETLLHMMKRDRIDAILGFHPDMAIMFDRLKYHKVHFSKDFEVFNIPVYLLCHVTEKNQILIKHVNQKLNALRRNGMLQEFLGRHAILAGDRLELNLHSLNCFLLYCST